MLQLTAPNIEQTHHHVSITLTMHLVCNINGATSSIGNCDFAFFLWFEVPDGVVVFWVLLQLFC
jgi:hypothetical protein